MDVSKLSDEDLALIDKYGIKNEDQLNVANKVKQESIKNGLNPDFVLPMVRHESNFNQSSISKDKEGNPIAYGVMQITPDTAKTYKCDDLKDIDQNISCGVRVLSDLISKPTIVNNPYKVLAGYNAGPNTPFVNSGDIADLPLETLNHMDRVSDTYGGDLPSVLTEKKDAQINPPVPAGNKDVEIDAWPEALVGAAIGAKVAGPIETAKRTLPLIGNVIAGRSWNTPSVDSPTSRASLQKYLQSQLAPNLKIPLTELERLTGGNKIRTMSDVQNALKAVQEVKSERVGKTASIDPKTGSPRQIFTQTPGRPAVDLSQFERSPTMATRAADQIRHGAEVMKSALPSVGRVGLGVLGGALAGKQLYEAFDQYKKEGEGLHLPSPRNAAQFASGAGGALAMLPFGVTQAAGLALQAPEVGFQAYDASKNSGLGAKIYDALHPNDILNPKLMQEDTDRMYTGLPM